MVDWLAGLLDVPREHVVAPLFIFLSAILGSGVAIWGVLSNRRIARMKNSMDFLNSTDQNEEIWLAIREINEFHSNNDEHTVECFAHDSRRHDDHAKHIRRVLNYYEAMAACISHGVYDDLILREMLFSTVTKLWEQTSPYVKKRRSLTHKTTYFQELEVLVGRWKKKGLRDKTQEQK